MAVKLGCKLDELETIMMIVAHDSKLKISSMVKKFKSTLGDNFKNFDELIMEFVVQGKKHVLRGLVRMK
ncbi:hypothetical protein Lal_00033409 [Lupinus albus]|nr:hypothetical protein Lal_00033409 [Lupinus albus]